MEKRTIVHPGMNQPVEYDEQEPSEVEDESTGSVGGSTSADDTEISDEQDSERETSEEESEDGDDSDFDEAD